MHNNSFYLRYVKKSSVRIKQENSIDFHIRWAWFNISRMYNLQAESFGGSMSIGYALLNIGEEGIHSTKLAPKMGMEPRSLTRMIKSLEENGLLTKEVDASDKRLVRLMLTEEGKKKRDLAKSIVVRFNESIYKEIDQKDIETTVNVLNKVNQLIDKNNIYN